MTEPVKCVCGRKPIVEVYGLILNYRIECSDTGCWVGPARKTKRGAIQVWAKVMGGKDE